MVALRWGQVIFYPELFCLLITVGLWLQGHWFRMWVEWLSDLGGGMRSTECHSTNEYLRWRSQKLNSFSTWQAILTQILCIYMSWLHDLMANFSKKCSWWGPQSWLPLATCCAPLIKITLLLLLSLVSFLL